MTICPHSQSVLFGHPLLPRVPLESTWWGSSGERHEALGLISHAAAAGLGRSVAPRKGVPGQKRDAELPSRNDEEAAGTAGLPPRHLTRWLVSCWQTSERWGDVPKNRFFQEEELFGVGAGAVLWLFPGTGAMVGALTAWTLRKRLSC